MDAAEFKQQFLPYHRKLYRTAFRLTENPQEAEDMVQEAYLKLWNKRDELAGVLNTEAYCVTLVKNLCYDALRRSRPDEDGHAPEELNLPTDTNIAREVEQRDEVNQVRRLIGRLPEQQKRVILLRDVNDCSFEEIEQATGLNAINIRVLLSRARTREAGGTGIGLSLVRAIADTLHGACIVVSVADDGMGIDEADQEGIFERYRQAGQSPNRRYRGTGAIGVIVVGSQ